MVYEKLNNDVPVNERVVVSIAFAAGGEVCIEPEGDVLRVRSTDLVVVAVDELQQMTLVIDIWDVFCSDGASLKSISSKCDGGIVESTSSVISEPTNEVTKRIECDDRSESGVTIWSDVGSRVLINGLEP